MSAGLIRGNAVAIPLRDESVDLVVTSPPYFALRSYRDDGKHYGGQIGSEPTPQAFLEALWSVMHECWRVLKPSGVVFVNLGDKRSGSGGHNNAGISTKSTLSGNGHVGGVGKAGPQKIKATLRNAPDRYNQAAFGRAKSKMLLPHRFAIGCEDGLADPEGIGWIVRQDQVWQKENGLPESVSDRTRDCHEYWFCLTKNERYYSATDAIREQHSGPGGGRPAAAVGPQSRNGNSQWERTREERDATVRHALGKLPGSVWAMPGEPLRTPEFMILPRSGSMAPQWLGTDEDAWRWMRWSGVDCSPWPRPDHGEPGPFLCTGPDHFAAFPSNWPRRLTLGWSPPGVCVECGEGRRPVVEKPEPERNGWAQGQARRRAPTISGGVAASNLGIPSSERPATITGYACACPTPDAPTTPAVVLDPFVGTGTVPMVARALGRYGVGIDLSADYLRLARWRTFESGHAAKAIARTHREAQAALL